MKMIAQIIGWFVFLALTKNFSHAQKSEVKFRLVDKHQTASVGSCAEIKCIVTSDLNSKDAYWFWMKDAVYNKTRWDATIIYSTNNAERPVSPDFQERVKYIGSAPSSWDKASSAKPNPQCSILICNLTKNDSGNYSARFVNPQTKWKTISDVNLTVIDNPCPITFVQESIESEQIKLTCSTSDSCPLNLQIKESTQSRPELNSNQNKSKIHSFTANWQDDGRIYSCQTEDNKDQYLIRNITLNVEYAPKETAAEINSVNITERQRVTLNCSAKGRPDASFTWFRNYPNYTEIVYSGAQWQITSIKDSQSGKYHCEAENKHGTLASAQLTIDVKYAPQVEVKRTPNASEVKEGDEITLTCNVKRSNPEPHVYVWHKDQRDIGCQKSQYVKIISPEDSGKYTCTAINSVGNGTSQPLEIKVKYMPWKTNIFTNAQNNRVKVGGSITFTCDTDANPRPLKYSWYRYNKNERTAPHLNPTATNQLILKNVQRTDEAQYTCNATNSIGTGENSMSLSLIVLYAPTNLVLSMDTEVKEGQLIDITCTVESFPPSQLQLTASTLDRWPSKLHFPKARIDEGSNSLRYRFSVTSDHVGLYTCRAQNEVGSTDSDPRKLVVKYCPKDVKVQVEPGVTVNENTTLTLHCRANCYPKATSFIWMKTTDEKNEKMQHTQETIQIKSVNASDRGEYRCEVSNEMGTGLSEKVTVEVKYAPKHVHIIKKAEQQDSNGERFVILTCNSQSYPPMDKYLWFKKDEKTDHQVSQNQTFKVYSNTPGVYYCIAQNEIYKIKSDPVNLFDRSHLTVLKFFFLALIILLIVFTLFFVYRYKRNKAIQQRTTNTSHYFDFLTWWNSASLRNLRNGSVRAEPFRSRDDLFLDQPCRPNAQRRQPQPDSTPASNINSVYCTVNLDAGNMGPSAQKPVRRQGGNTEEDSLNYASINFGNKQKKKQTKAKVEDVYAVVSRPKPSKTNGQGNLEDYENVSAVRPAKSPDPFYDDTDTSEDEAEINYSQVSFKAKPGHQRSRDSSTSDEDDTQYSEVKI